MEKKTQKKVHEDANIYFAGRLTPQNVEMEQAVLGAILINSEAINEVIDEIKSEYFYKECHQFIYTAMCELVDAGSPIDLLTVVNQLRKNKALESAGGPSYIATLTHRIASSANIAYHCKDIKITYIKRKLIQQSIELTKDAYENDVDIDSLIFRADLMLDEATNVNYKSNEIKHISDIALDAEKETIQRFKNREDGINSCVPTGLKQLDSELCGGWRKTELVILAGRPGMGKTAATIKFAIAAAESGIPTAIFELEMSRVRLYDRILLSLTNVDSRRYKEGTLTDGEFNEIKKAREYISQLPIYIDDNPNCTVNYIRATSKKLKKKGQCEIVFIDYLQLIDVESGSNKNYNREQLIGGASRKLKLMAKEVDIPVIVDCQLSRAVQGRASKKPILSDLRESGAIEQDADIVIFQYRPEYYKEDGFVRTDECGRFLCGNGFLLIEKNREGGICEIPYAYNRTLTKMWDWSDEVNYEELTMSIFDRIDKKNDVKNIREYNANRMIEPNSSFDQNESIFKQDNLY